MQDLKYLKSQISDLLKKHEELLLPITKVTMEH